MRFAPSRGITVAKVGVVLSALSFPVTFLVAGIEINDPWLIFGGVVGIFSGLAFAVLIWQDHRTAQALAELIEAQRETIDSSEQLVRDQANYIEKLVKAMNRMRQQEKRDLN